VRTIVTVIKYFLFQVTVTVIEEYFGQVTILLFRYIFFVLYNSLRISMVYFQSEQDIFAFEAGESDDQSISTVRRQKADVC
jgi:hypothetical protein